MKFARTWIEPALSAAAVAIAAALVIASGVAAPLERLAADALVRIGAARPPEPPADLPDVALVAIDPQSVRALPGLAVAAQRLRAGGAPARRRRAPRRSPSTSTSRPRATPRDDAEFAARARASPGRVVLAAFRQLQTLPGGGEIEVASLPIPALAARAAGHRQRADAGRTRTASCASRRARARSPGASCRPSRPPRSPSRAASRAQPTRGRCASTGAARAPRSR